MPGLQVAVLADPPLRQAAGAAGVALAAARTRREPGGNGLTPLPVDEACAADVADLGIDAGHRVLRVMRKGARQAKIPLNPATVAALDAYLAHRARRAGLEDVGRLAGPLLATARGGRLRQGHLWELVRRLAHDAGSEAWDRLSPIPCGTRRSPAPLTPARPCGTCRTTPGIKTPVPPAATTTPGQPGLILFVSSGRTWWLGAMINVGEF